MDSRKKKIMALLLAAVVAVTAIPVSYFAVGNGENTAEGTENAGNTDLPEGTVSDTPADAVAPTEDPVTIEDYTMIAESDSYKMYFYEPRLSVILENKETGELMETTLSDADDDGKNNATWKGYMQSGIVLTAIIGTNSTYQVDLLNNPHTMEVSYTENGFAASIYFTQYKFGLTVEAYLDGDDFVVKVPEESIKEDKEGTYIGTVTLFPMMGYTYLDDKEGYMLIPDGNGALIYLNDKEGRYSTGFSQMIYGVDKGFVQSTTQSYLWEKYDTVIDANQVIAPVFGMAHTEDELAYLAVVEKGETRAYIEAQPNGTMVDYNRCYARFVLRDVYIQPLNQSNSGTVQTVESDRMHGDLQVRYMLLSKDAADYAGMAVAYREYLLDNELLVKKDTSYNTRVDFLGTEREEFLMGTTAVTMTTTDNVRDIFADLKENGVSSLLSVYKGWQSGGLYELPINSYKADGALGGTKDLTALIKESAKDGYNIFLYNDALRINARTNLTTFDAVKMINKRTLEEEVNEQVYDLFYYLLPAKTESKLEKFINTYTKSGVSNLALAGITDNLFSYSSKGSFYDRNDTAEIYKDTLAELDANTNLVLEQPFAYLWNHTDAFLDMPLSSSEYMYVDEDVPFLSLVLKGILPMYSDYINFEANKTEFFLQMVEAGVYPSFYITYENSSALIYTNSSDLYSTQYDTYKNTITEYDAKLRELAEQVEGAFITDHEKMNNGVTKVTYDNGVVIYVNYSENNVTVDGVEIDALSYKVGEV